PTSAEPVPDPEGAPRKSFWTMVHGSTPVILTVLATILAGLSSSEMTLAQYHRALAAQNQSKASDQWTFFQFKRTQQKEAKTALDQMPVPSKTEKLDADYLLAAARQFTRDLQRAEREAVQLYNSISSSRSSSANGAEAVRKPAERLAKLAGVQV